MNTPSKTNPSQPSKASSMNKADLISSVAEISGLSKSDSAKAIDAMIQSIQKGLKEENEVRIMGFGTFCVTKRQERNGRNPKTGKSITIPASNHPKFKPGKILKQEIA